MLLRKRIAKIIQHFTIMNQGSSAIEFALVAPVFLLLLFGIFELGMIMALRSNINMAVDVVSRFGRTGSMVTGQNAEQTAASLLSKYTYFFNPGNLTLTVTKYSSFSSMPTWSNVPTNGSQDFGSGNDPVLYTLSYQWNIFTPFVGKYLSANGTSITIVASAVVQNEPF